MQRLNGHSNLSFFLLHGGAGPRDPKTNEMKSAIEFLEKIAAEGHDLLDNGAKIKEAAAHIMGRMEDCELFNAGRGSALQKDGKVRVTASYMDSELSKLSGVINIEEIKNPSKIAIDLQSDIHTMITEPGASLVADRLSLPRESLVTAKRFEAWKNKSDIGVKCDTVGCLAYHPKQGLISMTSTGGVGYEIPGRVSDCATVAGNYCSPFAAISVTGIGEEIVNAAVAARIETRVRDGMDLKTATEKTFNEAVEKESQYGWIALDADGNWNISHVTKSMVYLGMDSEKNTFV